MKPPAFQFYADDFMAGTSDMTNEEVGLYIRLLCIQWSRGHVTQEVIARYGRAIAQPSLEYVIAKFVKDENGLYKNKRMEIVRAKMEAFRINRSESGRRGAKARWNSHNSANGSAIAQPMAKNGSPSPSPSPSTKGERTMQVVGTTEPADAPMAHAQAFAERPDWKEFWAYCQQIGLAAEWYARDKFMAAEESHWDRKSNWRAYAQRAKSWWEQDGRLMSPPKPKNTQPEEREPAYIREVRKMKV